jgi:uncharacterized membrane protein
VFFLLLLVRRAGLGGRTVAAAEPWVLGAAVAGVALAGATGLLVWGQAQTMLRGSTFRVGQIHFWLGIALAVVVLGLAALHLLRPGARRRLPGAELLAGGLIALAAVGVQGYLGGRMTYEHAVGVDAGGELAQTATGAARLTSALARGTTPATAGKAAFSRDGLGCAACHGNLAQGLRGPRLAGGIELADFRSVHARGLFPPSVATDRDVAAIEAWLETLGPQRERRG